MILFSKTSEYALRATVCLASHFDQPVVTKQLAELAHVPPGYLAKVLQRLGRGDLVHSQRGLHGGFSLTRAPEQISLLDVVNAVDPVPRIETCPLHLVSHGTNLCSLHRQLDDTLACIEQALAQITLADLLTNSAASSPLCKTTTAVALKSNRTPGKT